MIFCHTEGMKPVLSALLVFLCSALYAQEQFSLRLPLEISIFSAGLATNAAAMLLRTDYDDWDGTIYDIHSVSGFDRAFAHRYNKTLDRCGDVALALSVVSPALLYATNTPQWKEITVMYAESVLFSYGMKDIGKSLVERKRPYMYFANPSSTGTDGNDWKDSFPSGHSTMAFTGASFASYVFCKYNPQSQYKVPVVATCFALATGTSALRMSSGNHFATDVLAGAAIGCFSGIFIPWLHTLKTKHKNDKIISSLRVSPQSISFSYAL